MNFKKVINYLFSLKNHDTNSFYFGIFSFAIISLIFSIFDNLDWRYFLGIIFWSFTFRVIIYLSEIKLKGILKEGKK
jgi:hypothetical protein